MKKIAILLVGLFLILLSLMPSKTYASTSNFGDRALLFDKPIAFNIWVSKALTDGLDSTYSTPEVITNAYNVIGSFDIPQYVSRVYVRSYGSFENVITVRLFFDDATFEDVNIQTKLVKPASFQDYYGTVINLNKRVKSYRVGAKPSNSISEFDLELGEYNPADPQDFIINNLVSTRNSSSSITLNWDHITSEYFGGYRIYKNGLLINTQKENSYLSNDLVAGQTYTFKVSGVDQFTKEYGSVSVVYTVPELPKAVKDFKGIGQDQKVVLSWSEQPGIEEYNIYYENQVIAVVTDGSNSYTVPNLTNGKPYYFSITAHNDTGISQKVNSDVITPKDTTAPMKPINLVGAVGNKKVNLFWSANKEADISGYNVYQDGIKLLNIKEITTTIPGLINDKEYIYTVTAIDTSGNESLPSNIFKAVPNINLDIDPPGTPKGFIGTDEGTTAKLSWTANNESDLIGYFIYKDGVRANYAPITDIVFSMYNLARGNSYKFTVSAIDKAGNESSQSVAVNVQIASIPPPKNIKAELLTDDTLLLTWDQTDPVADKFYIYQNSMKIAETTAAKYPGGSVTLGVGYVYQVSAVKNGIESDRVSVNVYFSKGSINYEDGATSWKDTITPLEIIVAAMFIISSLSSFVLLAIVMKHVPNLIQLVRDSASNG